MNRLRRNDRVKLFMIGDKNFEVRSKNDDVLLDSNSDYFIYMKNVNFRNGNIIDGRYLGELDDNDPILQVDTKEVISDGTKFVANGETVRTARMVAVNNKKNVIIIIGS